MTKHLFYIIIFSQIWLSIGSTCVHLVSQDYELIELIGEEEKEKEKEIEKEIELINHSNDLAIKYLKEIHESIFHPNLLDFKGRAHLQNSTPPPECNSIF